MYTEIALSRGTASRFIQTPRPRHSGIMLSFWLCLTMYLGIAPSLEFSSRCMQDARVSNPPARPS
eukprot:3726367-Pyramimonas_sp.AAC.1